MRRPTAPLTLRPIRSTAFGRLAAAGLLAVALLLAQQHAVLHWLSHAIGQASTTDKAASSPSAQHCADCDAVASFAAPAPPSPGLSLALLAGVQAHGPGHDPVVHGAAPWLAYRARAPPAVV